MTTPKRKVGGPKGIHTPKRQTPKGGGTKGPFTVPRQKRYCEILAQTDDAIRAREMVGVSYATVNVKRNKDPKFAEMVNEAQEKFRYTLIHEAYRRGVLGDKEALYFQGKPVLIDDPNDKRKGKRKKKQIPAFKNNFSDKMLELLLKRYISEFNPKAQVEVVEKVNYEVDGMDLSKLTKDERKTLKKLITKSATEEDEV
ncbi:MAG: hypothetical protein DRN92_07500 [Thermoproteota archaeon]|nr:MAG: hypothetical protein DRN92_07500 [Candidatus Korarchaeota archaeon]